MESFCLGFLGLSSVSAKDSDSGYAIHPMTYARKSPIRVPGPQCRWLFFGHGVTLLRDTGPAAPIGHRCAVWGSWCRAADAVPDWGNGAWRMVHQGVRCAVPCGRNGARDRDGAGVTIRLPEVKSNLPLSALILKNQWVAGCRWGVGGKGKTSP